MRSGQLMCQGTAFGCPLCSRSLSAFHFLAEEEGSLLFEWPVLEFQISPLEAKTSLSRPAMAWETFHWLCAAVEGVCRLGRVEIGHLPAGFSGLSNGG